MDDITEYQKKFPFLTGFKYNDGKDTVDYVGVVSNCDNATITMYDISRIVGDDDKKEFMSLGETWWWESNRLLPINVYLSEEMKAFAYAICTLSLKNSERLFGPMTSLENLLKKRIKRRSVQLMIKPK